MGINVLFWIGSFTAAITLVALSVLSDVCHQSQVTFYFHLSHGCAEFIIIRINLK